MELCCPDYSFGLASLARGGNPISFKEKKEGEEGLGEGDWRRRRRRKVRSRLVCLHVCMLEVLLIGLQSGIMYAKRTGKARVCFAGLPLVMVRGCILREVSPVVLGVLGAVDAGVRVSVGILPRCCLERFPFLWMRGQVLVGKMSYLNGVLLWFK